MLLSSKLFKDEELDGKDGEEKEDDFDRKGKESEQEEALFDPPLYKQRYAAVVDVINGHSARTVIDMGCAESQLMLKVKYMCPCVEQVIGVDIDLQMLQRNGTRLKPLTIEYVLKRERPLALYLYHGSIDNPDLHLRGADVLACVEVIEHLYPDTLAKVPYSLFGILTPKVVFITTPNCEYNVLFKDFSGMRHYDHKFEWTRQEFGSWCEDIVKCYPYELKICGVGEPPTGSDVGCCSQMAIFCHRNPESIKCLPDFQSDGFSIQTSLPLCRNTEDIKNETFYSAPSHDYNLVSTIVYPFDDLDENKTERVINETDYLLNTFFSDVLDEDEEEFIREVPVKELLLYPGLKKFNLSEEAFVKIIVNKFRLSADYKNILLTLRLSDFIRDGFSEDHSEGEDDELTLSSVAVPFDEEEECWD